MNNSRSRYLLGRLLGVLPTLFVIATLSFFMMRLAPGGPFDTARPLPPEIRANLDAAYGLDRPLWEQYARFMGGLLRGDFGASFKYRDIAVNDLLREGAPVSAMIGGLALLVALGMGVLAGCLAAYRQNSLTDRVLMTASLSGIILPSFVIAPLLIILFSLVLRWLPVAGWSWTDPRYWVLPVVAMSLPLVAAISRLTRASMLDVLRSNHVRTARARGLPETSIVIRHCLRPALLPVVSYLGPAAAGILTGSVVIETIFGLPGIGRFFIQGVLNRDYTLMMGIIVFYATLIILFNLLADLVYGLLDPRAGRG